MMVIFYRKRRPLSGDVVLRELRASCEASDAPLSYAQEAYNRAVAGDRGDINFIMLTLGVAALLDDGNRAVWIEEGL